MAAMSAGAMSAPPTKFASVSAINNTARQVGGALGAAALATILQSGTAADGTRTVSSYLGVYAFCLVLTGDRDRGRRSRAQDVRTAPAATRARHGAARVRPGDGLNQLGGNTMADKCPMHGHDMPFDEEYWHAPFDTYAQLPRGGARCTGSACPTASPCGW